MPKSYDRGTMRFTSSTEHQNLNKLILQGAGGRGINISTLNESRENAQETQHHGQRPCFTDENLPTQLHYDNL